MIIPNEKVMSKNVILSNGGNLLVRIAREPVLMQQPSTPVSKIRLKLVLHNKCVGGKKLIGLARKIRTLGIYKLTMHT